LKAFDAAAIRFGVRNEQRLSRLSAVHIPASLAARARLKDLSIVPVKPDDNRSEKIVEGLIFESGRPILMCPEEFAAELAVAFDDVVIAWDHTAPAARAVGDALPILQAAASVRIVTATDDGTAAELESGAALASHLAEHGIKATFETVKNRRQLGRKGIRGICDRQCDRRPDHGRLSSFPAERNRMGGATKTIIGRPPCWVLMSH
jgi:hypothetical protein